MGKLIGLAISAVIVVVLWVLNERRKVKEKAQKLSHRQYMLAKGIKTSVPYKDITIKSSYDRREITSSNQYMALELQTNGKGPQYEQAVLSYLTYSTKVDGEQITFYSQPFRVDEQYLLFALMGKDYVDVYTIPAEGLIYFDLEVAEQD